MKKLSLQLRLTLLSALLLTVCCVTLDVLIMNSAIMKLDEVGDSIPSIKIDNNEDSYVINLPSTYPMIHDALDQTKESFRRQCFIITAVIIVIGTMLTWFISGIALRPLKNLNRSIGEISASNLSTELPETGGRDEIATLTHSFNHMLRRINDAFLSQKQFSANAAHELRTPLAILQTNLEVFSKHPDHTEQEYNEMVETTLRQTGNMNHLISSLLELMSLHTATLTDRIDLFSLVEEVLMDLSLPAEKKSITLSQTGTTCTVQGNEVLLYRSVYNLVENAIKYNRENGTVNIDIGNVDSEKVRITITDTGNGIPKEHWSEIFKAFYRIDKARSRAMGGVGLGLALVNDIAELHNGCVFVQGSTPEGTRICIDLPIK